MNYRKILDKEKYLFLLVVLVAAILRLYKIGEIPGRLYFDEILYGLDSYSILKTGRDIYGHLMPLAFQSSGYYPPLYPYFLTLFIAVLGLFDWVVRLPAALAGVGVVIISYFLIKRFVVGRSLVPLSVAFLMAVSPWHIHLSRVAFLAGFGMFLLYLGIYLWVIVRQRLKFLVLGTIFIVLSMFTHYGYQVSAPLVFGVLVFVNFREIRFRKFFLIILAAIWLIAIFLLSLGYSKYNAGFRVKEVAAKEIFSVGGAYIKTFSWEFLFKRGENNLINNPWNRGQLPLSLLPLLLIGLSRIGELKPRARFILISLFLILPIPSALAGLGMHAVRNSPLLIPLLTIAALGIMGLFKVKAHYIKYLGILIVTFMLLETTFYLRYYFGGYSKFYGYLWGEPQVSAVEFAKVQVNSAKTTVFVDSYNVMLSYWSFQNRTNPNLIQEAILNPTTVAGLPSKKLVNVFFIATEEIKDQNFYKNFDPGTLVIDAINNNSFQYYEIK